MGNPPGGESCRCRRARLCAETRTLVLHNHSGSATGSIRIALEPFFSLAAHAPSPPAAAAPAAVVALPPRWLFKEHKCGRHPPRAGRPVITAAASLMGLGSSSWNPPKETHGHFF